MGAVERPLDRFLRTRGSEILGQTMWGRSWKVQAAVGGVCMAAAVVMGLCAATVGPPELVFGTIGPGIAGLINLGLGAGFRKAALKQGPTVPLSPEARALLHALTVRSMVWEGGRRRRVGAMQANQAWVGYVTPSEPPAEAITLLDRGAEAHNRLFATLGEVRDERATRLRAAADAGMIELLELTVRLSARPTDLSSGLAEMEGTVARLNELAERTEVSLPDATSHLRSTLESTLEELRAEDVARQELRG